MMNHQDKLNSRRILHIVSYSQLIFMTLLKFYTHALFHHLTQIPRSYKYKIANTATADTTYIHYLNSTEEGLGRQWSATEGGVLTGTTQREPCDLNYSCTSVWLACVQSLGLVLQLCRAAQSLTSWNAKQMHRPLTRSAHLTAGICSQTLLELPQPSMSRGFKMSALLLFPFPLSPLSTDVVLTAQSCFLTTSTKLNELLFMS